jgi:hypothetical protein
VGWRESGVDGKWGGGIVGWKCDGYACGENVLS